MSHLEERGTYRHMNTQFHPFTGKPAPSELWVDVPRLIIAYYSERSDPSVSAQRVAFGTSGHCGSAFRGSVNETHVLAICQTYRTRQSIGPLLLGFDTHALPAVAFINALAAANPTGSQR